MGFDLQLLGGGIWKYFLQYCVFVLLGLKCQVCLKKTKKQKKDLSLVQYSKFVNASMSIKAL